MIHAMKMEHPVRADAAGVVVDVRVSAGAAVAAGEVLVRVAPRET
ncbi:biotin/lipoyl-containing protein [Tepidiforma sp.]|nr:biotin/lipoyl-containing protein [Tepidiforma sp.]